MTVECPRCALHPVFSKTVKWIATGSMNTSRAGRRRAHLRCVQCGHRWSSGLPEALSAAHQVQVERGDVEATPEPPAVRVPAPTLFGPALGRTAQPMVSAGELARSVIADYKRRQGRDG